MLYSCYEEVLMKLEKYLSAFKLSSSRRFNRIFASFRISSVELLSLTIVAFALTAWATETGISIPIKRASSSWRDNCTLRSVISSILNRCSCTRFVNSSFSCCRILHSSIIARLSRSVCTWMSLTLLWVHWFDALCGISFCILTSSRCSFFKPPSNFL